MVRQLREAFDRSERDYPFSNGAEVAAHFGTPAVGTLQDELIDQIAEILPSPSPTGFDTHDLRDIARAFAIDNTISGSGRKWEEAILALLQAVGAGSELKRPDNPVWDQATTIARGLVALNVFVQPDHRNRAISQAAKRLIARGYRISVKRARPWMAHKDMQRATAQVQRAFSRLGIINVLDNLCASMRNLDLYHFDQYLTGRSYSPVGHDPSLPFGYLVNLAVRAPDVLPQHSDPGTAWRDALELARDLVAIVDVEPQIQFWAINASPKRLDHLLREIGHYDHLFGLKQWSPFITPLVLRSLFNTIHDQLLRQQLGWGIDEAASLSEAVLQSARTDPARLTRADLMKRGLTDAQIDKLLPHFVHRVGKVNEGYRSPLLTDKAELMFLPLVEGGSGSFIVPMASLTGPAFDEATMKAARAALPDHIIADITGSGTERVADALLRRAGLLPSLVSEKYNTGKPDEGEFDLVLEDANHIIFIECKAKALTRLAMAGVPGYALLDYAEGVLAAQSQALRHERLLRTNGFIQFDSGETT